MLNNLTNFFFLQQTVYFQIKNNIETTIAYYKIKCQLFELRPKQIKISKIDSERSR